MDKDTSRLAEEGALTGRIKNEVEELEELLEEVDIEVCGKANRPVPHARRYRLRVDRHKYVTEKRVLTGQEILELAEKMPPAAFKLFQQMCGGQMVEVQLDHKVDLGKPGIERFVTMEREQRDG